MHMKHTTYTKASQRNTSFYINPVPAALKRSFKAYCAKMEKSMREVIVGFMSQTVSGDQQVDTETERKSSKSNRQIRRRKTIDGLTIDLLQTRPISMEDIVNIIAIVFPNKDRGVLCSTTKRRLHGYLKATYGVDIHKDEKGLYSIR